MADKAASLKVFVSYSRVDVAFADQLVLALEDKGFVAILDRHDISGAENWRERLGKLILSADAVAFVLTAHSAGSEICSWEVNEAVRLGKRVVPLTPEALKEAKPPAALAELNWIPFYADPAIPGSGFYYGVKRLVEALSVDLDWLRAQTRYSERALEWLKDRRDDLLLRGEALKEAEAWAARTPAGGRPLDMVREYLAASGDAEQKRQAAAKAQLEEREQALKVAEAAVAESRRAQQRLRTFSLWALVAGVLLLAIAIPGNYFAATRTLDANDRRATLFAETANDLARQGDYNRALLMALAGDPPARIGLLEGLMRPDGNIAVRNALERAYASDRSVATVETGSPATKLVTLKDGRRFITLHEDGPRLWTMGETLGSMKLAVEKQVVDVFPLPDGDDVLMHMQAEGKDQFGIWNLKDNKMSRAVGPEIARQDYEQNVATVDVEGQWLIVGANRELSVWNIADGTKLGSAAVDTYGFRAIAASSEENHVVASLSDGRLQIWAPGQEVDPPVNNTIGDIEVLFAVDGSNVLYGAERGQVGTVDDDGELEPAFTTFAEQLLDAEAVVGMRVAGNQRGVLLVSDGGQARLLDMLNLGWSEPFGRRTDIEAADFVTDLGMVAAVTEDGAVMLSAFGTAKKPVPLDELFGSGPGDDPIIAAAFGASTAGPLAVARQEGGTVVWLPGTGRVEMTPTHTQEAASALRAVGVSRDGQTLFVGYEDRVDIWKSGAAQRTASWPVGSKESPPLSIQALGDGSAFFVTTTGGTGAVLKTDTGEAIIGPKEFGGAILAASPDGRMIAEGEADKILLHRAGVAEAEEIKLRDAAKHIAFSGDGSFMAVGLANGYVDLWRAGEERPFQSIKAHVSTTGGAFRDSSSARQVAVHADGKLIASAGDDGRAHLWKVGSPEPAQTFELPDMEIALLMIDASAQRLIGLTMNGVVQYDINPIIGAGVDTQVKLACERLTARGVAGFSDQDYIEFELLKNVPPDPCVTLVARAPMPAPVVETPEAATAEAPALP